MKAAPVAVASKPLKKKRKHVDEDDDEDWRDGDDDEDSDWDEDDDWDDYEGPGRELCAVRFPRYDGWSRKRYCYRTDSILDPGDWVVVDVCGENLPVLVVATSYGSLDMEKNGCISIAEHDKATKSIERLARKLEISRTKRKYPNARVR